MLDVGISAKDMDVQHHFEFKALGIFPETPSAFTCSQVEFEPAPDLEDEAATKARDLGMAAYGGIASELAFLDPRSFKTAR